MIRFGIAGFGLHAVRRLMPGFALAQRCKVAALSRRDPDKAGEAAARFAIPQVFASTEELCRCPEVDAVLVTTPNACHVHDVLTAVAAGKPVLCEKPMGINADECRQMVEAARRVGVLLGVAQVFRFEESTARFRALLAAGDIGRPIFARAEFSYPGSGHARTWLYNRAVAGGGPIADVGVHCIDALRYILQDEPRVVSASGRFDEQSGDVEAAASVTLEFERGTLATVLVSTRAQYRTPLEIVGEGGIIRADDALNVERPVKLELWRDGQCVDQETVSNQMAYARQVDGFAAALESAERFAAPGEEGWRNQVILDAAYRSMTSGKSEKIMSMPDDTGR
ncbi:MAG TPA: Gfo/Idh/MocA family oxidoreductase [Terriglobales bacterium]|jgi:predicted dehydrogenase|nr:Gfo/Idh/MocA family oxidoreductase [Terriglobales bacterium]